VRFSSLVHVVEVGLQRVEPVTPGGPVRSQPLIDLPERLGPEPVPAPLAVGSHLDQARLAQDPQVLGHPRLAEAQFRGQVADRPLAAAEQIEDAPPVRFDQNLKHAANIAREKYNCQEILRLTQVRRGGGGILGLGSAINRLSGATKLMAAVADYPESQRTAPSPQGRSLPEVCTPQPEDGKHRIINIS
jgi:hypothetical protein